MSELRAYSYSRLSTYEECPAQFGFQLQRKEVEPAVPLDLGIASHEAIGLYIQHCFREQVKTDRDAVDKIVDGLSLRKDRPLPEPYRKDVREVLRAFAGAVVLDLIRPQAELKLAFDAGWNATSWYAKDVRFRAVLDLIEREAKESIIITDWKTGHYVPTAAELRADDQLETYAFAAAKRWPSVERFTVKLYYVRQQWEHGPFEFTREELEPFGAELERRMEVADAEKHWNPVPGDHCQRCSYRKHCPAYRTAGIQATVPEDPAELAAFYFALKARMKDVDSAVKERAKLAPLPAPTPGKMLGYVPSRSWSVDQVEAVVSDLVEGGVPLEAIWKKVTLSKTSLGQLLGSINQKDAVGAFLQAYGSQTVRNNLKEFIPSDGEEE